MIHKMKRGNEVHNRYIQIHKLIKVKSNFKMTPSNGPSTWEVSFDEKIEGGSSYDSMGRARYTAGEIEEILPLSELRIAINNSLKRAQDIADGGALTRPVTRLSQLLDSFSHYGCRHQEIDWSYYYREAIRLGK